MRYLIMLLLLLYGTHHEKRCPSPPAKSQIIYQCK